MGGLFRVLTSDLSGSDLLYSVLYVLLSAAIVIFLTMPVHEWAHGFAASKLGDPTAKYYGRLRLNPLAHIDPVGALGILLFGIGWAKPVPVDPRYFKNPKRDMAITAFAGPLSNLIMAFLAIFVSNALQFAAFLCIGMVSYILYFVAIVFYYVAAINISLAVFNLVPIPPLDGSKILAAFLSDRAYYTLMRYERYFTIILYGLIFFSTRFSTVLSVAVSSLISIFDKITWWPFEAIVREIYK